MILTSLERAAEEHTELVEQWYMKRLSEDEGKFPAASAALWSGGAFLHVPKNLKIEQPIQVVYVIDEPGTAQYAHTLGVVGQFAECYLREYCLAPDFEGQALHAGGFELYCQTGSQVRLAHLQDWGSGEVFDISTKRVEIGRDAHCGWVPIQLGGHLTKQTLDIITAEQGADMRQNGLYYRGHGHLVHHRPAREGRHHRLTVWKGAHGRVARVVRGLTIVHGAQNTNTYSRLIRCCRRRQAD